MHPPRVCGRVDRRVGVVREGTPRRFLLKNTRRPPSLVGSYLVGKSATVGESPSHPESPLYRREKATCSASAFTKCLKMSVSGSLIMLWRSAAPIFHLKTPDCPVASGSIPFTKVVTARASRSRVRGSLCHDH